METFCLFATVGMIMATLFVGIGVIIGDAHRCNKEQCGRLDNCRFLSDGGNRNRSRDNGSDIPDREEIENVLYVLRLGASETEKKVIDYLIEKEGVD